MSAQLASPAHEVTYRELLALLSSHSDELNAEQLLAIAANVVGKLIAMQDKSTMTLDRAMQTVLANIQQGNAEVMAQTHTEEGHG